MEIEDKLLKEIGLRIKNIRQEKGIPQQDLADICNFEKSNMCRIEKGKNNLTVKTLFKISRALEVTIKELVDVLENNLI
ncbi:MAG: helix-turn-helix domain-containing protein [Prevotellaceae bacterium]|jgi:transcriptional regulator with XRE-family HTH domain|nr:helix-turn-helix domain-containing protein [Prevotellaceae bacterium]